MNVHRGTLIFFMPYSQGLVIGADDMSNVGNIRQDEEFVYQSGVDKTDVVGNPATLLGVYGMTAIGDQGAEPDWESKAFIRRYVQDHTIDLAAEPTLAALAEAFCQGLTALVGAQLPSGLVCGICLGQHSENCSRVALVPTPRGGVPSFRHGALADGGPPAGAVFAQVLGGYFICG